MATFTFIELTSNDDASVYRTVAIKGGDERFAKECHLSRFIKKHGLVITAMYQTDKPTLKEARTWLDWCIAG